MNRRKRKSIVAFVLTLLMVVSTMMSGVCTMQAKAEEPQTIYSLVHNYYRIKSSYNGQYLLGNKAGYEAQAKTTDKAMVFYFQASDLGEYILYDSDSKYLTYNNFNAIVRNKTLNNRTRFKVTDEGNGRFSLYSIEMKKYVGLKKTSLVWRSTADETTLFTFEECEGTNPFPETSTDVIIKDADGNDVPLSETMVKTPVGEPIVGYADTHAHLNHNLGSGQATFHGAAFSPLGITKALEDCTGNHGVNGSYDVWGLAVDGQKGHNTYGYPDFGYWPTAYSTDHQQTYYKWIERSYLAGQRLMVHQCVNNEILGQITNALPPYKNGPTDDMTVVDLQLENIYKLQDYVDAQCGGPGKGWFRICTNSTQARQVISEGKMAVFLSIEVDSLFGVKDDYIGDYESGKISEAEMNAQLARVEGLLNKYYDKGVRSLFAIHALNNGFGGCQLYQGEIFSIMNKLKAGDFYQPEVSNNSRVYYKQPKANLPEDAQGHGNTLGLTETGKWFIHKLINKKMIIECDHLSDKSFNDILDIVWEEKYPGIICSHTRILDMFSPEDEAWEQLDIPRMIKIYQLGGVVSPMLWETLTEHQKCASDYLEFMINLSASSSEPTSAYLDNAKYQKYGGPYEVPTTWYNQNDDPSDDLIVGTPYGSDVNGACMLPYFDKVDGVYGDVDYDNFGALYDGIYTDAVASVKFNKQTTGNRTFDMNGDRGVAHYGMIPDMWKKLSTRSDRVNIDATYSGAEAYIRMWERVEKYSATYPCRDESQWIVVSTEYWHDSIVEDIDESLAEDEEDAIVEETTEPADDDTEDASEETEEAEVEPLVDALVEDISE